MNISGGISKMTSPQLISLVPKYIFLFQYINFSRLKVKAEYNTHCFYYIIIIICCHRVQPSYYGDFVRTFVIFLRFLFEQSDPKYYKNQCHLPLVPYSKSDESLTVAQYMFRRFFYAKSIKFYCLFCPAF